MRPDTPDASDLPEHGSPGKLFPVSALPYSWRRLILTALIGVLVVLTAMPAHAALFLRFEPAEAAPGEQVVARTAGNGAFTFALGERLPVFFVGLVRERVGFLEVDQDGNGTLRFEVPKTLVPDTYEVEVVCPPCAAFSEGRTELRVGKFTVLEPPGPPFPEFPFDVPSFAAVILSLALVIWLASKFPALLKRRRSPAAIEGKPAEGIPAGALMISPSLGGGDLGWGSARHGFYVPPEALGHHMVVAGGTGSGKTNTSELLEHGAAITYAPQIIHFDCKGSKAGMERFVALMTDASVHPDRIRLFPAEPYDGWRGGSDPKRALLGRLTQVQDWGESFYEAGTKDLLQRVLYDSAPPSGSQEFLRRLEAIPVGANPKLIEGALLRYRGFFRSLDGALDGTWAFEDCDACYIQLEGFGLPSEAVALGRFLLEDLTHYLADRKADKRPVLVVLDEFSAISTGADAANMVERAREFGAGVVLTTQSYAGLGSGAERVLDAARGGLIIHSLANPEPFTKRAGTVWRQTTAVTEPQNQPGLIAGVVFGQKPETVRHTTRQEEFPRIDPNEVRQLPRGEAFLISGGRAQRVSFNRIELWDENIELARGLIEKRRETSRAVSRTEPERPSPLSDGNDADPDLDF